MWINSYSNFTLVGSIFYFYTQLHMDLSNSVFFFFSAKSLWPKKQGYPVISSLACMPGDSKFHKTTGHESQFLHLQGLMEFEIPVPGSSGRNCAWKLALTFSHVLSCRIPLWPRFRAKVMKTARIFLIDSDRKGAHALNMAYGYVQRQRGRNFLQGHFFC